MPDFKCGFGKPPNHRILSNSELAQMSKLKNQQLKISGLTPDIQKEFESNLENSYEEKSNPINE